MTGLTVVVVVAVVAGVLLLMIMMVSQSSPSYIQSRATASPALAGGLMLIMPEDPPANQTTIAL